MATKRKFLRSGGSIVVLGPDGSGKSTLVRLLQEEFGDKIFTVYLGISQPSIRNKVLQKLSNPTRSKSRLSALAVNFFLIPLEIFARLKKNPCQICLIERLPLSALTYNPIFRSLLLRKLKPLHLVILLEGDASIFQARRSQEETVFSVEKEQIKHERLLRQIKPPSLLRIDSTKVSADGALRIVADAMSPLL